MSRLLTLLLLIVVSSPFVDSKDKPKTLPAQVLRAETIFVVIDPDAGEPLTNPTTNSTAREDVEKALMQWGRFHLVMEPSTADLVLSVRKGNGRAATPTIKGGPIDNRPVVLEPNGDSGIRIGAQQGHPPGVPQVETRPRMGTEVTASEDTVALYLGRVDHPLDSPSIWRYTAKDALHPPKVPAIDELRKVFLETEKATQQKKKP
jgi:hypothetical protein